MLAGVKVGMIEASATRRPRCHGHAAGIDDRHRILASILQVPRDDNRLGRTLHPLQNFVVRNPVRTRSGFRDLRCHLTARS